MHGKRRLTTTSKNRSYLHTSVASFSLHTCTPTLMAETNTLEYTSPEKHLSTLLSWPPRHLTTCTNDSSLFLVPLRSLEDACATSYDLFCVAGYNVFYACGCPKNEFLKPACRIKTAVLKNLIFCLRLVYACTVTCG